MRKRNDTVLGFPNLYVLSVLMRSLSEEPSIKVSSDSTDADWTCM